MVVRSCVTTIRLLFAAYSRITGSGLPPSPTSWTRTKSIVGKCSSNPVTIAPRRSSSLSRRSMSRIPPRQKTGLYRGEGRPRCFNVMPPLVRLLPTAAEILVQLGLVQVVVSEDTMYVGQRQRGIPICRDDFFGRDA